MHSSLKSLAALPVFRWIDRRPDVLLAVLVACLVAMMLFPLPLFALDTLISINIALSVTVLLVSLFARNALEVSSFPSLLLLTTLFRLGLNVSTTRSILAHAKAGDVVDAFGEFVVQGDVVVGLVIFLVVTLVQFMVIAKGAERVAEVAARFTLDAMPGKQMSIDAALRSGSINEEEAQEQRDELNRASQMFGNMDGAMKFVKGDALAGLLITAINLLGGLIIGVFRMNMTTNEALEIYSSLTIGDALVAQIASMLITLAAGILVTRVEAKEKERNLGFTLKDEIFGTPKVLFISAFLMTGLGLVPGLPMFPFFTCAGLAGLWGVSRILFPIMGPTGPEGELGNLAGGVEQLQQQLEKKTEEAKKQKALADSLSPSVVPISVDVDPVLSEAMGFDPHGDEDGSDFISMYVPQLRDALYLETGVRFPGVRIRPFTKSMAESSFMVRINDVPALQERIPPGRLLATVRPEELEKLAVDAQPTSHPVSKAKMSLILPADREAVEASGIAVWDTCGIVALYLASVLRQKASAFVGLQEVAEMMERMDKAFPALVKEVVPKTATLQQLVGVLRRLVEENVCIRDLKSILEALGEYGAREAEAVWLTERVRSALSAQLAHSYAGLENRLPVVLLDPVIEDTVANGIQQTQNGPTVSLDMEVCRELIGAIALAIQPVVGSGKRPVILTNSQIRRFVRRLIESDLPQIAVLSFDELPGDLTVQPLGRAEIASAA